MDTAGKSQPLSFPPAPLTSLNSRARPTFGFIVFASISYSFHPEKSPVSAEQIFVTVGI